MTALLKPFMRNNHPVPTNRFKKTAIRYKTWFHEEARTIKRQQQAKLKAKKVFPKPLERLYPIVRSHTLRYNKKERLGRGFTAEELAAVDLDIYKAKNLGIAVDLRRRNHNQEAHDLNIERLKAYLSRLTIYNNREEARKADVKQHLGVIMPIQKVKPTVGRIAVKEIKSQIWAAQKVKDLIEEEKQHKLKIQKMSEETK